MTLQLYVLRQLLVGIAFAVGGMVFIAVPGIAVNAVHRLGGVSMGTILGYLPLVLVDLVPYLVPIGFLLAVVSTYGRLAADNEWTAICMAGISPLRMLLPAFVLALAFGGLTGYLERNVSPTIDLARREHLKSSLASSLRTLSPGRTQLRFGAFFLDARFRQGNEFRDVLIHVPAGKDEPQQTVLADRAAFEFDERAMRVSLVNARRVHSTQDTLLGSVVIQRDLDALFKTSPNRRLQWKYQKSRELVRRLEAGEIEPKEVAEVRFEVQRRNALAATCVMFLLLGAPTGLILRRGTQLGALSIAVGYALVYYLLSMRLGKAMAVSGLVPEWLSAWAVTLIGTAGGLALTWRIARR